MDLDHFNIKLSKTSISFESDFFKLCWLINLHIFNEWLRYSSIIISYIFDVP